MEENLENILSLLEDNTDQKTLRPVNPVILAWVGDGIFSYYIRKYLMKKMGLTKIHKLNKASVQYVKAEAQSLAIHELIETELTDEEKDVVRRGRNTKAQVPKHASILEYRYSTGFEALLGWLALQGQFDRVRELTAKSILIIDEKTTD